MKLKGLEFIGEYKQKIVIEYNQEIINNIIAIEVYDSDYMGIKIFNLNNDYYLLISSMEYLSTLHYDFIKINREIGINIYTIAENNRVLKCELYEENSKEYENYEKNKQIDKQKSMELLKLSDKILNNQKQIKDIIKILL